MRRRSKKLPRIYPHPAAGGAFTVREFCDAHSISVAFYYVLRQEGLGPREMPLKSKILISYEAAAEWRRQREDAARPPAA